MASTKRSTTPCSCNRNSERKVLARSPRSAYYPGMTKNSPDSAELQKTYWRSRRGMLELDLLLVPFTVEAYADLAPADQSLYRQLLGCEDQDLHSWLMRRESAESYQPIIDRILAHNSVRSGPAD